MAATPDLPPDQLPGAEPDPRPGPTVAWGVIGIVLTVVIILILEVGYYVSEQSEEARKREVMERRSQLRRLVERQRYRIEYDHYAEEDGERALDAIPVERAMELLVQERQEGPDGERGPRHDPSSSGG